MAYGILADGVPARRHGCRRPATTWGHAVLRLVGIAVDATR